MRGATTRFKYVGNRDVTKNRSSTAPERDPLDTFPFLPQNRKGCQTRIRLWRCTGHWRRPRRQHDDAMSTRNAKRTRQRADGADVPDRPECTAVHREIAPRRRTGIRKSKEGTTQRDKGMCLRRCDAADGKSRYIGPHLGARCTGSIRCTEQSEVVA